MKRSKHSFLIVRMTRSANLTSDDTTGSSTYGYTYLWDAMGRLTTVTSQQTGLVVAEYRYSADNHRIAWRYNGSANPWFYPVYDHRWRMIALYKQETSGPPSLQERFYYHNAGLAGSGGSQYIDSVIARDDTPVSGSASQSSCTSIPCDLPVQAMHPSRIKKSAAEARWSSVNSCTRLGRASGAMPSGISRSARRSVSSLQWCGQVLHSLAANTAKSTVSAQSVSVRGSRSASGSRGDGQVFSFIGSLR